VTLTKESKEIKEAIQRFIGSRSIDLPEEFLIIAFINHENKIKLISNLPVIEKPLAIKHLLKQYKGKSHISESVLLRIRMKKKFSFESSYQILDFHEKNTLDKLVHYSESVKFKIDNLDNAINQLNFFIHCIE